MKLNKIMAFFCIGLPICVCLRIFQIIFTIEFETGFYINEFETIGKVKTVYDLNGRVVENPSKGIYIINGKKCWLSESGD